MSESMREDLSKAVAAFDDGAVGDAGMEVFNALPTETQAMMCRYSWRQAWVGASRLRHAAESECAAARAERDAALSRERATEAQAVAICERANRAERERDEAVKERDAALGHLGYVLPMAKGYAAANRVGSNERIVAAAGDFLHRQEWLPATPPPAPRVEELREAAGRAIYSEPANKIMDALDAYLDARKAGA